MDIKRKFYFLEQWSLHRLLRLERRPTCSNLWVCYYYIIFYLRFLRWKYKHAYFHIRNNYLAFKWDYNNYNNDWKVMNNDYPYAIFIIEYGIQPVLFIIFKWAQVANLACNRLRLLERRKLYFKWIVCLSPWMGRSVLQCYSVTKYSKAYSFSRCYNPARYFSRMSLLRLFLIYPLKYLMSILGGRNCAVNNGGWYSSLTCSHSLLLCVVLSCSSLPLILFISDYRATCSANGCGQCPEGTNGTGYTLCTGIFSFFHFFKLLSYWF